MRITYQIDLVINDGIRAELLDAAGDLSSHRRLILLCWIYIHHRSSGSRAIGNVLLLDKREVQSVEVSEYPFDQAIVHPARQPRASSCVIALEGCEIPFVQQLLEELDVVIEVLDDVIING